MREDLYDRSMEVGSYYHVYNRGVARQPIFLDDADYQRFLDTLSYYLDDSRPMKLSTARLVKGALPKRTSEPLMPLAEPIAHCLMPNHFHLVLHELTPKGISRLMRRVLLSYTRYFNTRHQRVGPIFQGTFRFVRVLSDEQLLHLTRYVHLNPFVARLMSDPESYRWSSYDAYKTGVVSRLCHPTLPLELAGSAARYRAFVTDFASYAVSFHMLKDHAFEEIEAQLR